MPVVAGVVITGVVVLWRFSGVAAAGEDPLPVLPQPAAENRGLVGEIRVDGEAGKDTSAVRIDVALTELATPLPRRARPPACRLVRRESDPEEAGVPGRYVAGLAASPLAGSVHGQQVVRFDLAGGVAHYRVVRIPRGTASDAVVPVLRGSDSFVRGRVVDSAGRGLPEARVWLAGSTAETDADGRFEVPAQPVGFGLPLVVRHRGHASRFRILDRKLSMGLETQPIALTAGVRLRVRVYGVDRDPETTVVVLPSGGHDSRWLQYPLFWPVVEPHVLDADGMATLDGLPRGARARVLVRHPSGIVKLVDVRLDRADVSCVVHLPQREILVGRLRDELGRPIAAGCVTTRRGGSGLSLRDTGWLLPPDTYVQGSVVVRPMQDGCFAVPVLRDPEGLALMTAEAPGRVGLQFALPLGRESRSEIVLCEDRDPDPLQQATSRPRLVLEGDQRLGPLAYVKIVEARGQRGPYPWHTARPFEIPLGHPALLRVGRRIGDGAWLHHDVLVRGKTTISIER